MMDITFVLDACGYHPRDLLKLSMASRLATYPSRFNTGTNTSSNTNYMYIYIYIVLGHAQCYIQSWRYDLYEQQQQQ